MNDTDRAQCPRIEDISALVDGELGASAARELKMHAAQCAACGPVLLRFTAMHIEFQGLRDVRSDVDIASLVLPQLPQPKPRAQPQVPRRRPSPWGGLAQLGPRAVGGAAALGIGAWLGLSLVAGGAGALRPAAMSVFDGEPPGAYCAGLPSCTSRGR